MSDRGEEVVFRCDGRVTREDGSWRPCDKPNGHGVDASGFGCATFFAGEGEPVWNPRDTERRKGERRAPTVEILDRKERQDALLKAADAWWDAWAKHERWWVWYNDPRPEACFGDEFGPETDEDVIRDALRDAESALIEAIGEAKRTPENIALLRSVGALPPRAEV